MEAVRRRLHYLDIATNPRQIFEILAASRIRTECAGDESKSPLHSGSLHFGQRVREQRVPVPIPPIDGDFGSASIQLLPQRGDQSAVLVVDRAPAANVIVMLIH